MARKRDPNSSGKNAEDTLHDILCRVLCPKGYNPVQGYKLIGNEMICRPLFGESGVVDSFVRGLPSDEGGLIFSSKRQDSDGSVQQKVYYHIDYMIKRCYFYPTILVMVGDAWHANFLSWAKTQEGGDRLKRVFFETHSLLSWLEEMPPKVESIESANKMCGQLPLFK